jgi:hypothetical protein
VFINCLRRILLAVFVLALATILSYIGEAILRRNVQAMSTQESIQQLSSDKQVSLKPRIERLGPGGEVEWSLEADRMEFSFDDNGDITVIDCFGNVIYSRGAVIVRSASGRYDMTQKRFIFGGSDDR